MLCANAEGIHCVDTATGNTLSPVGHGVHGAVFLKVQHHMSLLFLVPDVNIVIVQTVGSGEAIVGQEDAYIVDALHLPPAGQFFLIGEAEYYVFAAFQVCR